MSVNPFQTMRARYFLIVFALLTVVARASNELIENTFHMQNSTFYKYSYILYPADYVDLF